MADKSPIDDVMNDPKKKESMQALLGNPSTKKLMDLLNQKAGGDLKSMATAAMRGDTSQLVGLMNQVMNDPDGAKAVKDVTGQAPK